GVRLGAAGPVDAGDGWLPGARANARSCHVAGDSSDSPFRAGSDGKHLEMYPDGRAGLSAKAIRSRFASSSNRGLPGKEGPSRPRGALHKKNKKKKKPVR